MTVPKSALVTTSGSVLKEWSLSDRSMDSDCYSDGMHVRLTVEWFGQALHLVQTASGSWIELTKPVRRDAEIRVPVRYVEWLAHREQNRFLLPYDDALDMMLCQLAQDEYRRQVTSEINPVLMAMAEQLREAGS